MLWYKWFSFAFAVCTLFAFVVREIKSRAKKRKGDGDVRKEREGLKLGVKGSHACDVPTLVPIPRLLHGLGLDLIVSGICALDTVW